jgi:hypothetical protein
MWIACGGLVAIVSCSLGLSACNSPSRLEGHWKGTFVEGAPPEAQASAMAFAKSMEVIVRGENLTVVAGNERIESHFVVDSEDKTTLILHTDRDGVGDKQTFTFNNGKVMKWTVAEGKPVLVTFVRE